MISRGIRLTVIFILILILTAPLTGCWDNREIEELFIVTGVALDQADDPEQIDITLQVGETRREGAAGSAPSNEKEDSVILLETGGKTIMGGLIKVNRDSNHKLLMHHNQVLLFGIALAEKGIGKHIDLFMRDQQARLEVPLVVVEGRGKEPLVAKLAQEEVSGIFLAGMLNDMARKSVEYRVRLIDFASRLLDETTSPIMPIVKVIGEGEAKEIRVEGMAIFKADKMIGRLTNYEVLGYIWSMGKVENCDIEADSSLGKVAFSITRLDCERKVTLRQDGGVRVNLNVEANINLGEIQGYDEMMPNALMLYLDDLAQQEIRQRIIGTFEIARELNADIYGFGTSVHRKYRKEWKNMKGQWDQIFPDIELNVQVNAHIQGTGQIVQSLEMEQNMNEN